jgi:hypothetical protein
MSKEMTAAEVREWMLSQGMKVPKEIESAAENAARDAIETHILESFTDSESNPDNVKRAEEWRERLTVLSDDFVSSFKSQDKNVGRGSATETALTIEFPDGSTFFIRHRVPKA